MHPSGRRQMWEQYQVRSGRIADKVLAMAEDETVRQNISRMWGRLPDRRTDLQV